MSTMTEKFYIYDGNKHSRQEMEELVKSSTDSLKKGTSPRLSEAFKMLEGKDVLDVGCASGSISKYIAQIGYKVHAIEHLKVQLKLQMNFLIMKMSLMK